MMQPTLIWVHSAAFCQQLKVNNYRKASLAYTEFWGMFECDRIIYYLDGVTDSASALY